MLRAGSSTNATIGVCDCFLPRKEMIVYFQPRQALAEYFWEHPDLTELELNFCPDLTNLPRLPGTLKSLKIYNCSNLKDLPKLPDTLTELLLYHCHGIKTLPVLPSGLKGLRIYNCPLLPGSSMVLAET
jgi:hypothetical protein